MDKKLKVVLLCHYWSPEAEEMVGKKHFFRELSPWIQERLNLFKNKDDIELHVVAPNYTKNTDIEVKKDGIHYHFYHYAPSLLSSILVPVIKYRLHHDEPYKIAERAANTLTKFATVRKSVVRIIDKISPDLIHIFGTENPDYSTGIIPLMDKYPVLVSIQGYAYMTKINPFVVDRMFRKIRIENEAYINRNAKYMYLSDSNPEMPEFAPFRNNQYTIKSPGNITRVPKVNAETAAKEYDISFFGRVSADKGVEDLAHAVGKLHTKGIDLKVLIIGKCVETYQNLLKSIVNSYGADNLLTFSGFVEDHEEMYELTASARMVVLPTRVDLMPNTIRESMAMGLPVVASDAGYITSLNDTRESIAIHKVSDIDDIADKIEKVYTDVEYRNLLISNARITFKERFSMDNLYEKTIEAYKEVCEDYYGHSI